jgi:hypothetical protein
MFTERLGGVVVDVWMLRWAQEVVAREEVNPEYFTISASGVVHLQAGARAEFSPLGEWMREKSIFNVLTRMNFFKHYLVYKCYHSWRSSVRQKLFAQVGRASGGEAERVQAERGLGVGGNRR